MIQNIFKSTNQLRQSLSQISIYNFNNAAKKLKESELATVLKSELDASFVKIEDTTVVGSACGTMYKMVVQSPLFKDKTRIEQHRMVFDVIDSHIGEIHGFNLKTIKVEIEQTVQANPNPPIQNKQ